MKICHVVATLDPAGGGPPVVAPRLAAAQAQLGHEVTVTTFGTPDRQASIDAALGSIPHLDAVTIEYLTPPRTLIERVFAGHVRTDLDRLITAADVVHLHGLWAPLLRVTAVRASRLGAPYVIRPAGMLDPWCLTQRRLKKKVAMLLSFRRILNRALFLHALNRDERDLIGPLKLTCPFEVIPNGLFLDEIDAALSQKSSDSPRPHPSERPYFLFLSRLHYKKGLDILADAFAVFVERGGEMDVIVAGPDDGESEAFKRRVRDHGIDRRVHVIGPIYGPQKLRMLRDAVAFVLPSRQEGFSLAITEAMAARVPVLITEGCHFPEVAEVGAGLVTRLDAQEFAEAMTQVAGDSSAAAAMGRAGRAMVESRYTWATIAEQSVDAYRRFMTREETDTAS